MQDALGTASSGGLLNITTLAGLLNSPYQCERYYGWFPWQPSTKYITTNEHDK